MTELLRIENLTPAQASLLAKLFEAGAKNFGPLSNSLDRNVAHPHAQASIHTQMLSSTEHDGKLRFPKHPEKSYPIPLTDAERVELSTILPIYKNTVAKMAANNSASTPVAIQTHLETRLNSYAAQLRNSPAERLIIRADIPIPEGLPKLAATDAHGAPSDLPPQQIADARNNTQGPNAPEQNARA